MKEKTPAEIAASEIARHLNTVDNVEWDDARNYSFIYIINEALTEERATAKDFKRMSFDNYNDLRKRLEASQETLKMAVEERNNLRALVERYEKK